jgi:predicted amidophosphoribosyltransferase
MRRTTDSRRSEGVAFPPLPAVLVSSSRKTPHGPALARLCACCGQTLLTSHRGGFCPRCGFMTDSVEGA